MTRTFACRVSKHVTTVSELTTLFSIPQGFETRGTELSQRLSAWNNLQKATQSGGTLTDNPSMEPDSPHFWMGPAAAGDDGSSSPDSQAQVRQDMARGR